MSGPAPTPRGLASVIVPCFNQLAYTRLCLAALARHTRPPWELIVVADGSTDGTPADLAELRATAAFPVRVITNPTNRGFPAACNQGLQAARGAYLVLLNNEAVVTEGWLDQLIALAESQPRIGLVGPMSNYVAPPQLVEPVPYADLEGMHRFAAQWRAEHRGQWFTTAKLSGFCLLLKRAVLDVIGSLDEQFGPGLFDDDDLAERARRAGFALAVAHDLFVHHFGSRTIADAGLATAALRAANQAKFAAQWGPGAVSATAAGGVGPRPTVSLTMIVRDEQANLPACLESARDLFDELIVVDTGSTDRTVEVARSFGARVFDFIWVEDFAAARNAALARATGDYAFWLDADDRIESSQRDKLKTLLAGLRPGDEAAHVVRCVCDPDPADGGAMVVDHVRLFPVREDVRWTYRVHEQILPALRRAAVAVRWTDVTIRHVGYVDPVVRRRKRARDEAILHAELTDRPDDPFLLFNLGALADERQDWQAALSYLTRSLAGSAPGDSITRKLYALIARAHQRLGALGPALAACGAGLAVDPDDAELLFRKGIIHRLKGEPAAAAACWNRVLTLRQPERFSSVDAGIYGHLTRRNLAALAADQGDHAAAVAHWAAVLAERPGDADASRALARLGRPPGSGGGPGP